MAKATKGAAQPPVIVTSEPAARPGSIDVGGEPVSFAFPDWVGAEMQLPLDARITPRKAPAYPKVWEKLWTSVINSEYQGLSADEVLRAKSRPRDVAPTSMDLELEAHTLVSANARVLGGDLEELTARALAHWTSISDPETATRVALRTYALVGLNNESFAALRDHERAYGAERFAAAIGEATAKDDRTRALLLDDEAAAKRLLERAMADGSFLQAAVLVGIFSDADTVSSLVEAISKKNLFVLRASYVLRAVRRHGLAIAKAVLAHVEAVMKDPAHRDTEKAPWIAVLACYPSQRAARAALALAGAKSARPALLTCYRGMRDEAKSVLEVAKNGKGKAAKNAAELLTELG